MLFGRVRLGIRSWLFLLVVSAILPTTMFSGFSVYELAQSQREGTASTLAQRTEASANAVAARLSMALTCLNVLAASSAAESGDAGALYVHARRILSFYPYVVAISLVDPDGRQVFNTLRPFGETIPPSGELSSIRGILETGQPGLSPPFKGTLSNEMAIVVGVPVMLGGGAPHVLRLGIRADSFNAVLREQRLPEGWPMVLFDGTGMTVARTRSPETSVGVKVSADLLAASRDGHEGIFEGRTREGQLVATAVFKVPGWDWWIASGVPTETLDAPVRRFLWQVVLGGVTFLALSCGVVLWLSHHLAQKIRYASVATVIIGEGENLDFRQTGIAELDAIGDSLEAVKERREQAEAELLNAKSAHQQVSDALSQAQTDALTGLAGRGLFMEKAQALLLHCTERKMGAAFMLIDLDGFKQVNDTLGHDAGDTVLVKTADILRRTVRGDDVSGRLGGDEFVVLLAANRDAMEKTAALIARRIVAAVGEIGWGVSCSIGVAVCAQAEEALAGMIQRADEAMYQAKRAGKGRALIWREPTSPSR